ncbi:ATP-dependent helicase [Marinobacter halodurans]|uniref:DNA 3'-5' helicase n=1 Tax=Marinobacter halodurans TaxID=2528979 RepID=A0ABY1ZPD7_9GAMM|nr:ATP-dependent helicase [Marinobacter halodurans]TBW57428.1 ATP-dependent helicase [Marinobacter halodurans]
MAGHMSFTEDQTSIINHAEGPVLVLAGAGSGKTAVLVERAAQLIESGKAVPSDLLLITFSRKAAREMRTRLKDRLQEWEADGVRVETFHGFGYQFMRENKVMFGLKDNERWAILSESDQKRMMTELCHSAADDYQLDRKRLRKELTKMFKLWSRLKQDGVCPTRRDKAIDHITMLENEGVSRGGTPAEQVSAMTEINAQVLLDYEKQKVEERYLDFDDLLLHPARMLKRNAELAWEIGANSPFIMVDESQDTNLVQYVMVREIAKTHTNIMLVGDDDQSIYAFRGARVANVKRFARDFGATVMRLERNFRSHPGIVDAANSLIQHNQARLSKRPYSEKPQGEPPVVNMSETDRDMAMDITSYIEQKLEEGTPLTDIAILYRTNRMAQILEPSLKRAGIPYTVVGGMSFFERNEIQAVISCVRLAEKPDDWQALKSLEPYINGVGKKGMSDFVHAMKQQKADLMSLTFESESHAKRFGKAGPKIRDFMAGLLENTLADSAQKEPHHLTRRLIEWVKDGPMQLLEREKDDVMRRRRHQNLEQLVDEVRLSGTKDFIDYLLETPISDYQADEHKDVLTLSTIHRSKGLEYPHVIIAGFSDGLIPFDPSALRGEGMSLQNEDGDGSEDGGRPEEERRLGYVALTRGQESVYLACAKEYCFPGNDPVTLAPSRFVREMGISVEPAAQHANDAGRIFAGLSMG